MRGPAVFWPQKQLRNIDQFAGAVRYILADDGITFVIDISFVIEYRVQVFGDVHIRICQSPYSITIFFTMKSRISASPRALV